MMRITIYCLEMNRRCYLFEEPPCRITGDAA